MVLPGPPISCVSRRSSTLIGRTLKGLVETLGRIDIAIDVEVTHQALVATLAELLRLGAIGEETDQGVGQGGVIARRKRDAGLAFRDDLRDGAGTRANHRAMTRH